MKFLYRWSEEDARCNIERCHASRRLAEGEQDEPPRRPARFFALALKALCSGEISTGRFAEYLGISRIEARRYVEQEEGEHEEVAVATA